MKIWQLCFCTIVTIFVVFFVSTKTKSTTATATTTTTQQREMSSAGTRMIYGTAWKKDNTARLVFEAIQSGFRRVDTGATRVLHHTSFADSRDRLTNFRAVSLSTEALQRIWCR